jgi:hypothetical protein
MNIYKCRVTFDVVVEGENAEEALEAIYKTIGIDGLTPSVGAIVQVNNLIQLPDGWTGAELAFSKWEFNSNEQSIKYWLDHPM